MPDIANKTPEELQQLIADAQAQLEEMQRNKKKGVIAQIKELAASIGVTAVISEPKPTGKKAHNPVVAKYVNPNNHAEVWTGRGVTPKWMQALIAEGHKKEDLVIKG
jgi:DNA-binding protein H-NS